ncbi:MAG: hypothetical protein KDC98_16475, partial [Planctomycetes bacterium]|nr:hypothetical protein [Planctomycetota bacterium]
PKQIAARLGIPLATVKSRLQRGLAMLRAEFDRRDRSGRWRGAVLAATGFGTGTISISFLSTLIMAPTTKLLATAAATMLAAWLVYSWSQSPAPGMQAAATTADPARAALAHGDGQQPAAAEREPVAIEQDATPQVDLGHPFAFRLRCRVVDLDGLPVHMAQLAFAPGDGALNGWRQVTSRDGVIEIDWRGKVAVMTIAIGVTVDGRSQSLQRLEVEAGPVQECVLLGDTGGIGGRCQLDGIRRGMRCGLCHQSGTFPDLFDVPVQARDGLHPESRLFDVLIGSEPDRSAEAESAEPPAEDDDDVYISEETEVATGGEEQPGKGAIHGIVYDGEGRPAAGQPVVYGCGDGCPEGRTDTDDAGRFTLTDVRCGTVEVRAGGRRAGLGRTTVTVFADRESACQVDLDRGHVLRGTVLGDDGKALPGWRVEFVAHDGRAVDAADVQADGSYLLANLPNSSGTLLLHSGAGHRLPMAIEPNALPGATNVDFDLRDDGLPAGSLLLQPRLPAGLDGQRAGAFAWQIDSGRGAAMPRSADGILEIDGLRAGFYRVVAGCPGSGWLDLGQHWVDGINPLDLGAVELPAPGRLRLAHRPGHALELWQRRADVDVRARFVPEGDLLSLPAGTWLALQGARDALQAREFVIDQQGETVLDFASPRR